MSSTGHRAELCRPSIGPCGCIDGAGLIDIGSPIYYERPMQSILDFIELHKGFPGRRVAVYITCLAVDPRIPAVLGRRVTKRYLGAILSRINGAVVSHRVFRGWLRGPRRDFRVECVEWARELVAKYS